MTVAVNDRRIQYTATSGQTVFPYDFKISADTEIEVKQTLASNGSTSTLTLTTNYAVSGVGNAAGGNITLVTGAALNDIITLTGLTPLSRTTDFNQAGDFLASELNDELDKLTNILQEQETSTDLSLRAPTEDTGTSYEIPSVADRAGKFLNFDASGNPSAAVLTGTDTLNKVDTSNAPTVNDDVDLGYSVGSLWLNQSTNRLYICIDASNSAAVWRELIILSGGATQISNSGNNLVFSTSNNQFGLRNDTEVGSDDGICVLGAAGELTSNRTAQLLLYGINATASGDDVGGFLFLTAATAADKGRIFLENTSKTRRGIAINTRFGLTPGSGYSAVDVPDPDGSLHVFGNAGSLGTSPEITGYTAASNANLAVFEQKTSSNGITIATENNVAGRINFDDTDGTPCQITYDHSNDYLSFSVNSSEALRIISSGILLIGKSTSDVGVDGVEINDDGFVQCTNDSDICGRWNREGSDGTVIDIRNDNVTVGSISISGSATAYNTSSDKRLKENIKEYKGGLDQIQKIDVKTFNLIADKSKTERKGVIAQEIENNFPELVTTNIENHLNDNCPKRVALKVAKERVKKLQGEEQRAIKLNLPSKEGIISLLKDAQEDLKKKREEYKKARKSYKAIKHVDYSGFVPYLISAVQEQQKMISELQRHIKALKK